MKKKLRPSKKQLLAIAGIAVLLIAAVVVGLLARSMVVEDSGDKNGQEADAPTLPAKIEEVQNLRTEGKEEESSEKIEESLADDSTDGETRYMLYIQQGHLAYDKQDWNAAAESYGNARKIKATAETAEMLGYVNEESGKNAEAIEFFKEAIRLTPTDNPRYEAIKEGFEARIKHLGGQP